MRLGILSLALLCVAAAHFPELDVTYSGTVDLYLPAGKDSTNVVYTYRGGWHAGSEKSSQAMAQKLQSLGYVCALVSRHLWPPNVFPALAEEVAAALGWVGSQIARTDAVRRRSPDNARRCCSCDFGKMMDF